MGIDEINRLLAEDKKVEPCPFCGGRPRARSIPVDGGGTQLLVLCPECDLIAITNTHVEPDFNVAQRAWGKKARALKFLLVRANLRPGVVEHMVRIFRQRY